MNLRLPSIFFLLIAGALGSHYKSLQDKFTWKILEFGFKSAKDQQHAIATGNFDDPNRFPTDLGVLYNVDESVEVFLTLPRFARNSAYSLAKVSNRTRRNGPVIYAYPSYEWQNNNKSNCDGITSAHRVAINNCNQMWVIDSGVIKGQQICSPQVLAFDLKTNNLIHRYKIPSNVYTPGASVLLNIILDTADPAPIGKCQRNMVYIADGMKYGIIVYDPQKKAAWRIQNKLMDAEKDWEKYTIANQSFVWSCGIYALNVSPRKYNAKLDGQKLYFHALSSNKEASLHLRDANNQDIWKDNANGLPTTFEVVATRKVQSFMEAVDSRGNLFASTADPLRLFVWNVYDTTDMYNTSRVVADDQSKLQFVSGMKVAAKQNGEEVLWVLSGRDQKFATNTFDPSEVNFRVMFEPTQSLLKRVVPWLAYY